MGLKTVTIVLFFSLSLLLCVLQKAGVFDAYIPPEGDARLSSLSKEGLKQRTEQIKQTAASQLA